MRIEVTTPSEPGHRDQRLVRRGAVLDGADLRGDLR
jgi:hypothetical protein